MNKKEFKALFPLKAMVTQEIIDNAFLMNPKKCIGALTLNSVLPKGLECDWGVWTGMVTLNGEEILLTTIGNVEVMGITIPQELTFVLK